MAKKGISAKAAKEISSLITMLSCAETIVHDECAKSFKDHDLEKTQHWMQVHRTAAATLKEKFGVVVISFNE